jgi:hypothetical protein
VNQLYVYARRFIDPNNLYRRWLDPRIHTLRLADVVAYLRERGWAELPPDRPGYRVFREPPEHEIPGGPYCQFVPDSEADDLPLRMFELITGLAEVEDRQASEVIDDILRQAKQNEKDGVIQDRTQAAEIPRNGGQGR